MPRTRKICHLLPTNVLAWINNGEHGLSSAAMFYCFTGIWILGDNAPGFGRFYHPYDPDDLRRCVALLDRVPAFRARLPEMATVSPEWEDLVAHWDTLEASLREEMATGKEAPKTYSLMKALFINGRAR